MTLETLGIIVMATLLAISPINAAESGLAVPAKTPEWFLVDEIIRDDAPEYRSEIYFANKASVVKSSETVTVAISMIATTGWPDRTLAENIRDLRSNMVIDCSTRAYQLHEQLVYDGDERPIASLAPGDLQKDFLPSAPDRGFGAIVGFACEADSEIGRRQSPAHMQPLTWFIAYISADWSK
ncbi:MAG: hypothetical protein AAGE37_09250 [Pseudomonadota bacterium]